MGKFAFKVAYTTDDEKIQPALDSNTIDAGDLIIKDNSDGTFTMRFIDQKDGILKETGITDDEINTRIVPTVLEEVDDAYVKKDDIVIVNGGTSLDVPVVVTSVSNSSELAAALADTSITNITLTADITDLTEGFIISNRNLTIDLAGYTITNSADIWSNSCVSLFTVKNGTLTLTGNGSIIAKENDCYVFTVRDNSNLVIEDGTYNGNITTAYIYGDNASIYISGGTFKIQQLNTNNVESPYGLMINVKNNYRNTAYVEITGGAFEHYNPAAPEEGDMVYLPDGYTTEHDEAADIYTVVKEG